MSGYVVANYDVTNPDGYKRYLETVGSTLTSHGAEILAADYDSEVREGTPGRVTIILRFESPEAARGWYESSEYQAIVHHRTNNSDGFLVICEERRRP